MFKERTKVVLFLIFFISIFLMFTQYTDADLFADRKIKNRISFTTLSFSQLNTANNSKTSALFKTTGIQPGGFDIGAVRIKKDGQLNFQYHLNVITIGGDKTFCDGLQLEILQKGITKYNGKLTSLNIDSQIQDANPEDWIFLIRLDDNNGAIKNKSCEFNFHFKTWRQHPDEKGGIFAETFLNNIITSGMW